ncbi:BTAD domain-containing putative transcriptional regulator [Acidisphaera sp. L21]|uniref:BTAD domain-containing putative transcriptional regulator n=1 Tax=Acidisphaera sp. L21 TaxID=1641851 RepID=UPI00131BB6B3|nr:BTAD domain-containing putative transcriptional regulator [Acidisphaera sp. L21]
MVLPLGRKTRALLAILALSAPRPIMRPRLAELLWSRRLEEQARASLRQEIHRLLEALQPVGADVLRVTRDHLAIRSDLVWIDVNEVLNASVANPSALSMMTAELLEDFDDVDPALDQWLLTERARLRDHARGVAEVLLKQQTSPDGVIQSAQQLLGIDRAHEGGWRALIRAHAERGERGLAIQAFERCRVALAERLDAAPSQETQRLVTEVRSGTVAVPPQRPPAVFARPPIPEGERQSVTVGVRPLQLIGSNGSDAQLGMGLAEDIAAALSQFQWLSMVPSSSLTQFDRDATMLRRSFGVDFLLDGNIHQLGSRTRASVWLMDLRDENRIAWSQRFDWTSSDILTLQDDMVAEIAAQLGPEIQMAESRRVAQQGDEPRTAYDLVLRALPLTARLRRDEFNQAELLLNEALTLDPDYAPAHVSLAYHLNFRVGQGWASDVAKAVADAGRHASRAIALDPASARAFAVAGHVRAFMDKRPREALELHARALSLNPNLPMAWGFSAATYTYLGELDEAARRFARYKRLSPNDPNTFLFDAAMTLMELQRRDYDAAIQCGRRTCELNPNFVSGFRHYLCALGHAGLTEEATRMRSRLLALDPTTTVATAVWAVPLQHGDKDHYAAGLLLAGLPAD